MGHNVCLDGITLLWLAGLNIGNLHMMHYGITWSVGISNFEKPLTVPLYNLNDRQITSLWRQNDVASHFDVITRCYCVVCPLGCHSIHLLLFAKTSFSAPPKIVIFRTFAVARDENFMKVWWHFRFNKIWCQCLVPISTTRFASDVGIEWSKNEYGYIRK